MFAPIITTDGVVLAAPRPPRLADEVHPNLWLGGSWTMHTERFDAVYSRLGTVDGPTLPADLDDVVSDVVAAVRAERKVLVRCAMGLNRSGIVVALALRQLRPDLSGYAVLGHLRHTRSPHVLCNPAFEKHVVTL